MEETQTVTKTNTVRPSATTTPVVETTTPVVATTEAQEANLVLRKVNQVIWFFINLLAILVVIRFILLLFGATPQNIVRFIYDITNPFVYPFKGIFGETTYGDSYFEAASLLAIAALYLIGFAITSFLSIFIFRREEASV